MIEQIQQHMYCSKSKTIIKTRNTKSETEKLVIPQNNTMSKKSYADLPISELQLYKYNPIKYSN
jgi:hypothetical protein